MTSNGGRYQSHRKSFSSFAPTEGSSKGQLRKRFNSKVFPLRRYVVTMASVCGKAYFESPQ